MITTTEWLNGLVSTLIKFSVAHGAGYTPDAFDEKNYGSSYASDKLCGYVMYGHKQLLDILLTAIYKNPKVAFLKEAPSKSKVALTSKEARLRFTRAIARLVSPAVRHSGGVFYSKLSSTGRQASLSFDSQWFPIVVGDENTPDLYPKDVLEAAQLILTRLGIPLERIL